MAAISVVIVVLVSLLVARIGTVALTLTGLSRESARFQARSAFFGVGFTTVDAALTGLIRRALRRWSDLDVRDWAGLLELEGGYTVAELEVEAQDWVAGRALAELTLR